MNSQAMDDTNEKYKPEKVFHCKILMLEFNMLDIEKKIRFLSRGWGVEIKTLSYIYIVHGGKSEAKYDDSEELFWRIIKEIFFQIPDNYMCSIKTFTYFWRRLTRGRGVFTVRYIGEKH